MANDEDYALEIHRQLNAIPLRRREKRGQGQELTVQQSLNKNRKEKQGKPRAKRTSSSSQEHPSSRRRRNSDPDDYEGHTSAHQRLKREPAESNQSHPGHDDHHHAPHRVKQEPRLKQSDSRDSDIQHTEHQHQQQPQQLDLLADLHDFPPSQAAAILAARTTRQQLKASAERDGPLRVKVFYAGVRWGLSLQPAAVKTRQLLAKALNDAFVGEILSVGQGECLTAVFLDVSGATEELGPTKWSDSKDDASRWKSLAKSAARIYVRGPECLHKTLAAGAEAH